MPTNPTKLFVYLYKGICEEYKNNERMACDRGMLLPL